jgi:hypothetical protein
MATYLLAIELEYKDPITEEQIDSTVEMVKKFANKDTGVLAIKSALTDWPDNKWTKWLLKWQHFEGCLPNAGPLLTSENANER